MSTIFHSSHSSQDIRNCKIILETFVFLLFINIQPHIPLQILGSIKTSHHFPILLAPNTWFCVSHVTGVYALYTYTESILGLLLVMLLDNLSHQKLSFAFISLPFIRASNITDTSGLMLLLLANYDYIFTLVIKIFPEVKSHLSI